MYTPQFTITNEINKKLIEIEKLKQNIDTAHILPQQIVSLRYRATVEDTHSSTTIEGNTLNKNQVEDVISGKLTSKNYAVIEVANYKKALDWINKEGKKIEKISVKEILKLHYFVAKDLLPKSKVGQFRQGPVYIVDIENNKEIIRYEGPSANKINLYLEDLLNWLEKKDEIHPIIKAAIFHYEFVSIHPFSDGNGRVTRLLVKLLLLHLGYSFKESLSLDHFYLENRLKYYEELNQALNYQDQRKADLTSWLNFFITGFLSSVEKLANQVAVLSVVKKNIQLNFSEDDIAIIDYLKNFGSITSNDVIDMLGINERTTQRKLKKLLDNKIIVRKGAARNITYELADEK